MHPAAKPEAWTGFQPAKPRRSTELLRGLAELAREHGFFLVSDEIYEHLIYEGEAFSPAQVAPDWTITVNGVAKTYAMTGWRIGYAAGPKEIITAMTKIQGQSVTHPTSFAQWATITALERLAEIMLEEARVVVVPGTDFVAPGHVRMSYAT